MTFFFLLTEEPWSPEILKIVIVGWAGLSSPTAGGQDHGTGLGWAIVIVIVGWAGLG